MIKAFLSVLLFAAACLASPPVIVVNPQNPKPGDVVTVTASGECNFDVRGAGTVTTHGKRTVVFDMSNAVVVLASSSKTPALSDVAVISLGAGSTPIPPTPDNAEEVKRLSARFQSAYGLEAETDKAESLAKLVELYKGAGKDIDAAKTYGDLQESIKQKAVDAGLSEKKDDLIIAKKLKILRQVISSELISKLPTDSDVAVNVAEAKKIFATFAESLQQVK